MPGCAVGVFNTHFLSTSCPCRLQSSASFFRCGHQTDARHVTARARHFDIRPEGNDSPECGWCALYQIHHNVLYALFRDGGRQSPGFGSADGFGRGMGAIAQGRAGGMSISLGAA